MAILGYIAVLILLMALGPYGNGLAALCSLAAVVLILFVVTADHSEIWRR